MSDLPYPDLLPTHRYNSPWKVALGPSGMELVPNVPRAKADPAVVRRQRILLKLGALWEARPEDSLANVVGAVTESDGTPDYVTELALDNALKAEGLSVSGGWKS